MKQSPLMDKSKTFALQIIQMCREIKAHQRESVLTNQVLRSGTSIGANIREAFFAHSRADFVARLRISLKECAETEYWLELLIESGYWNDEAILVPCIELKKMLITSIKTAEEKLAEEHQIEKA